MTRWTIEVPDETDRQVREYLSETNGNGSDLSRFVDEAVQEELFRRMLQQVRERNADLSPEDAQALANEAVAWARANRT